MQIFCVLWNSRAAPSKGLELGTRNQSEVWADLSPSPCWSSLFFLCCSGHVGDRVCAFCCSRGLYLFFSWHSPDRVNLLIPYFMLPGRLYEEPSLSQLGIVGSFNTKAWPLGDLSHVDKMNLPKGTWKLGRYSEGKITLTLFNIHNNFMRQMYTGE